MATHETKEATTVLSAGTLTGDDVRNMGDEKIGTVEELMIDIRDGRVSYAVMSFGGFMGLGNKLFAIPWAMLEVDTDAECFRMDIDKEVLEDAPGFEKDDWPEVVTHDWLYELYVYYDLPPYWS